MNLESLILEIKAEDNATKVIEEGLKKVKLQASALEKNINKIVNLKLKATVDDSRLYDLNKHLELKKTHTQKIQKFFDSNPLTPKVDLSNLKNLDKALEQKLKFEKKALEERVKNEIKAEAAIQKATASNKNNKANKSSSVSRASANVDFQPVVEAISSLPTAIADEIEKRLGKSIDKAASPGIVQSGLGSILSGASQGGFQSFFGSATKDLSKGINSVIKTGVSEVIGDLSLVGEKMAEAVVSSFASDFKTLPEPIQNAVKDYITEAKTNIVEALGAENVVARSRAGTVEKEESKAQLSKSAKEGLRIERKEALKERHSVRNEIAGVEAELEKARNYQAVVPGEISALELKKAETDPEDYEALNKIDDAILSLSSFAAEISQLESELTSELGRLEEKLAKVGDRLEKIKLDKELVAPPKPEAYLKALHRMGGKIPSDEQIPELVVNESMLKNKGAEALYSGEANAIVVSQKMKNAIDEGTLTAEQLSTLLHEIQHAIDFDFGSAEGLKAMSIGELGSGEALTPTTKEMQGLAPFISLYSEKDRKAEINAELAARREMQNVEKEEAKKRINESLGFGGTNAAGAFNYDKLVSTGKQLEFLQSVALEKGAEVVNSIVTNQLEKVEKAKNNLVDIGQLLTEVQVNENVDPRQLEKILLKQFKEIKGILEVFEHLKPDVLEKLKNFKPPEIEPEVIAEELVPLEFPVAPLREAELEYVPVGEDVNKSIAASAGSRAPVPDAFRMAPPPDVPEIQNLPTNIEETHEQVNEALLELAKIAKIYSGSSAKLNKLKGLNPVRAEAHAKSLLENVDDVVAMADEMLSEISPDKRMSGNGAKLGNVKSQLSKAKKAAEKFLEENNPAKQAVEAAKQIAAAPKVKPDINTIQTSIKDLGDVFSKKAKEISLVGEEEAKKIAREIVTQSEEAKREIENLIKALSPEELETVKKDISSARQKITKSTNKAAGFVGDVPAPDSDAPVDSVSREQLLKARDNIKKTLAGMDDEMTLASLSVSGVKEELRKFYTRIDNTLDLDKKGLKSLESAFSGEELKQLSELLRRAETSAAKADKAVDKSLRILDKRSEVAFKAADTAMKDLIDGKDISNSEKVIKRVSDTIRDVGLGVLAFQGISSLGDVFTNVGESVLRTSFEFKRLESALNFSTGGKGAEKLGEITQSANDLGISISEAAEGYKRFSAATKGTTLEAQTDEMFAGVASAVSMQGLNAEQTNSVFIALSQMASKGRVSLEELTGQLGESLPNALQAAAESFGVSRGEFIKMVESGNVLADELLPKLASNLESKALTSSLDPTIKNLNIFQNQLKVLQVEAGKPILVGLGIALQQINKVLGATTENFALVSKVIFTAFVVAMSTALQALIPFGAPLKSLISTMLGLVSSGTSLAGVLSSLKSLGRTVGSGLLLSAVVIGGWELFNAAVGEGYKELKSITDQVNKLEVAFSQAASKGKDLTNSIPKAPEAESGFGKTVDKFLINPINKLDEALSNNPIIKAFGKTPLGRLGKAAGIKRNPLETYGGLTQRRQQEQASSQLETVSNRFRANTENGLFDDSARGNFVRQMREIEREYNSISSTIRILRREDSEGNKKEIESLEAKLQSFAATREKLSKDFLPLGRGGLEAQLDVLKKQEEKLMESAAKGRDVNLQLAENKNLQEQINRSLDLYDQTMGSVSDNTKILAKSLSEVNSATRDAEFNLEKQSIEASTESLKKQLSGEIIPAKVSLVTSEQDVKNAQKQIEQIAQTQSGRKGVIAELTANEVREIESLLGSSIDSATIGSIEKAIQKAQDYPDITENIKTGLDALQQYKEGTLQLSQAENEVMQARLQLKKDYEEYANIFSEIAASSAQIEANMAGSSFYRQLKDTRGQTDIKKQFLSGDINEGEMDRKLAESRVEEYQRELTELNHYKQQRLAIIKSLKEDELAIIEQKLGKSLDSANLLEVKRVISDLERTGGIGKPDVDKVLKQVEAYKEMDGQIATVESGLVDARIELKKMTDESANLEDNVKSLARSFAEFKGLVEGTQFKSDLSKALAQNAIKAKQLSGAISEEEAQKQLTQLEVGEQQTRLQNLQTYQSERLRIIRSANAQERETLTKLLGAAPEVASLQQIVTAQNLPTEQLDQNVSELLSVLSDYKRAPLEAAQAQQSLLDAQLDMQQKIAAQQEASYKTINIDQITSLTDNFKDAIKGVKERYQDFLDNLADETAEIEEELKDIGREISFLDVKNSIRGALTRGSEGLGKKLADTLLNMLGEAQGISDSINSTEREAREIEKFREDNLKQLEEMQDDYNQAFVDLNKGVQDLIDEVSDIKRGEIKIGLGSDIAAVIKGLVGASMGGQQLTSQTIGAPGAPMAIHQGNASMQQMGGINPAYSQIAGQVAGYQSQAQGISSQLAAKQQQLAALQAQKQQHVNQGQAAYSAYMASHTEYEANRKHGNARNNSLADLASGKAYDPSRFEGSIPGVTPGNIASLNKQNGQKQHQQNQALYAQMQSQQQIHAQAKAALAQNQAQQSQLMAEIASLQNGYGVAVSNVANAQSQLQTVPQQIAPQVDMSAYARQAAAEVWNAVEVERPQERFNDQEARDKIESNYQKQMSKIGAQRELDSRKVTESGFNIQDMGSQLESELKSIQEGFADKLQGVKDDLEGLSYEYRDDLDFKGMMEQEVRGIQNDFKGRFKAIEDVRSELEATVQDGEKRLADTLNKLNSADIPDEARAVLMAEAELMQAQVDSAVNNLNGFIAETDGLMAQMESEQARAIEHTQQKLEEERAQKEKELVANSQAGLLEAQAESYGTTDREGRMLRAQAEEIRATLQFENDLKGLQDQIRELGLEGSEMADTLVSNMEKVNQIKLENIQRETTLAGTLFADFKEGVGSALTSALTSFAKAETGILESMSNLAKGILESIATIAAEFASQQIMKQIFGMFGGMFGGGGGGQLAPALPQPQGTGGGGILSGFVGSVLGGGSAFGGLFANGGTVPNYASGGLVENISSAFRKERAAGAVKPQLAVLHQGEEVLSTLNKDAQFYQSLKKSGMWDSLKKSGGIDNYALGTSTSRRLGGESNRKSSRPVVVNSPITVYSDNPHTFKRTTKQLQAEQEYHTRRAYSRFR